MLNSKNYNIFFFILTFFSNIYVNASNLESNKSENQDEITPLMEHAIKGNISILRGIDLSTINAQSKNGMTALHYAIRFGHEEVASFLIEKGASPLILDDSDHTALSMARANNQQDVVDDIENSIIEGRHLGIQDQSTDKHFMVLIASYNNERWVKKNLKSIIKQNYNKFTIIYLNDQSTDDTSKIAKKMINKLCAQDRIIFVDNKVKRWALGNYIFAIERFCPNKSIIVLLDGDDWLISDKNVSCDNVLSTLNGIYQDPDVWITYGESCTYPLKEKYLYTRDITQDENLDNFRKTCGQQMNWPIHHLRTFYSGLFRKIKMRDFLNEQGDLFKHTEDVSFMLPMIEMAGITRIRYTPYWWYAYNVANPIITPNRFGLTALKEAFRFICSKEPYDEIDSLH